MPVLENSRVKRCFPTSLLQNRCRPPGAGINWKEKKLKEEIILKNEMKILSSSKLPQTQVEVSKRTYEYLTDNCNVRVIDLFITLYHLGKGFVFNSDILKTNEQELFNNLHLLEYIGLIKVEKIGDSWKLVDVSKELYGLRQ